MSSDLDSKLQNGYLIFYGYSYTNIPDQVDGNFMSRMNFYFKTSSQTNKIKEKVKVNRYSGYQDTGWEASDVVLFDQDSVKSLIIGYPSNAKYVLINCSNLRHLHWIVLGLIRRLLIRQVKFFGFKTLTHGGKKSFWIILKREQKSNNNNFYLSREVGIDGFLKFLYKSSANYVIPRHFESLPNLHREGGDLDLIVSDEDELLIKRFLLENEGDIRVDIWSVSRPNYHGITYMPPHISQSIIDNSIEGKSYSRIPNLLDTFNSMIFHALYHKGFQSGIISIHSNDSNGTIVNNDYLALIKKYGYDLGISIEWDMESLDDYMHKIEWRPAIDTLAKIAQWNEWVRLQHFSIKEESQLNLFAMILKTAAVEIEFDKVVIEVSSKANYAIIENSIFNEDIKKDAIKRIRGGVWNDGLDNSKEVYKYHPAQIILLLDRESRGEPGIRQLKETLRKKIDKSKTSLIHTTDNDIETWDYINICLPNQEDKLRNTINSYKKDMKNYKRNFLNLQSIQFRIFSAKTKIKSLLIDILSH